MKEKTANTLLCQTGDSQKRMIIIEAQETFVSPFSLEDRPL